jgi:beta-1,4-N-acetylglucosaminyltransferase
VGKPRFRICIVSSCGGHLTEVRCLREAYEDYDHFYVLNDKALLPPDMEGRTHFVTHSERDWKQLVNLYEAWRMLSKARPDVILSTGAGPVVPFALVGKLFFGTKVIFVETITRIHSPSLTGRLMYLLADEFFYQWESLSRFFPHGHFVGRLI